MPKAEPGLDPATRTFQALRIAVNDELGELDRGLARRRAAADAGRPAGGRVVPFARRPAGQGLPAAAQRRRTARLAPRAAAARHRRAELSAAAPARRSSPVPRRSPATRAPARRGCAPPSAPQRPPWPPVRRPATTWQPHDQALHPVLAGPGVGRRALPCSRSSTRCRALADQLAHTDKQADDAERDIRVLDAEWAYLNRPDALAQMNQRYLVPDADRDQAAARQLSPTCRCVRSRRHRRRRRCRSRPSPRPTRRQSRRPRRSPPHSPTARRRSRTASCRSALSWRRARRRDRGAAGRPAGIEPASVVTAALDTRAPQPRSGRRRSGRSPVKAAVRPLPAAPRQRRSTT